MYNHSTHQGNIGPQSLFYIGYISSVFHSLIRWSNMKIHIVGREKMFSKRYFILYRLYWHSNKEAAATWLTATFYILRLRIPVCMWYDICCYRDMMWSILGFVILSRSPSSARLKIIIWGRETETGEEVRDEFNTRELSLSALATMSKKKYPVTYEWPKHIVLIFNRADFSFSDKFVVWSSIIQRKCWM